MKELTKKLYLRILIDIIVIVYLIINYFVSISLQKAVLNSIYSTLNPLFITSPEPFYSITVFSVMKSTFVVV